MIGSAIQRGFRMPGWGIATLDNGKDVYVSEEDSRGFNAILDYCDRLGYETQDMRNRLEHWVKTGE